MRIKSAEKDNMTKQFGAICSCVFVALIDVNEISGEKMRLSWDVDGLIAFTSEVLKIF